jgi:hypothetical protein
VSAPYFDDGKGIRLYHGDAREIPEWLAADALLVDPPYGIDYQSGWESKTLRRSIAGDKDTAVRDDLLAMWGTEKPAIVFGSWKQPRPVGTHTLLIWDTQGAPRYGQPQGSMEASASGDVRHRLRLARPPRQRRLLRPPVQSAAKNGRLHPHEKPVPLLRALLEKARPGWTIADPTCGSGSLLVAARLAGLSAIGVEREESDCELVARRLTLGDEAVKRGWDADVLDLGLDGAA